MAIGDLLVKKNLITREQLQAAKQQCQTSSGTIENVLVEMGLVSARHLLEARSEQLSIPMVDLSSFKADPELLKLIPSKVVHRYRLFPVERRNGTIRVATNDPFNLYAFDELRMLTGMKVEPVLAYEDDVARVIKEHYGVGGETVNAMVGDDVEVMTDVSEEDKDLIEMAQEATVVKLVNEILLEAIRDKASDVHVEPFEDDLRIRYRIDGVLHTTTVPPQIRRFHAAIVSRIKILSNLNIAEHRLPQDGGFKIRAHNREIDLRVSILPTAFGSAVVMRILDKTTSLIGLDKLGMQGELLPRFQGLIDQPYGIILVTGPTGSGKTTTLYSALKTICSDKIKILTIEDPIEYYLDGINQVKVNPKIGLTFASGLRSFLRHDPDVILVGEIRDYETAEVAINASLTGHLVFSTLHTNDAVTANTRLLDMGIEPFLVASSVSGVLAQRLVRKICTHCREAYEPDPDQLPSDFEYKKGEVLHHGKGCRECRNSGYRGRFGIFELMCINDEIRELVVGRVSATDLFAAAVREGLKPMRHDGWDKVRRGETTIEEVARVTKRT
ncbi:MAG: Flp pilus assembly complex ATPase component TadA [Phycisphaerales bacterium]|nr:Flp pilus assembly complex ATPase component TadA [Phycisphaerales bacterium]